jgi:UDP-N-acetylmuramyl tripeptide synthase
VDTEQLTSLGGTLIVAGDRVYDLALRLAYSRENNQVNPYELLVHEDLKAALEIALEKTALNETLHILPTYSAMLEVRQILTGRKIL